MKLTIIIVALVFFTGCASKHKKLMNATIGLNKRQVLARFSSPIDTYRSRGKDHWVYESVKKAKNSSEKLVYTHTLSFENGILIEKEYKRSFTSKELQEFKKE